MIGKTYGVFNLSCDYCGEMADRDFDTFQDAVDYAKRHGWRLRRMGNEWENICPECLDFEDEMAR